jgi:manganese-dependent inorganic pyrophosphatase
VETTDDEIILEKCAELLVALSEDKDQKGYSVSFLAVVNIVKLKSTLLLCGPNEKSLAFVAFPQAEFITEDYTEPVMMDLGGLVSRKKDFIPAVSNAMKKGWSDAPVGRVHKSKSDVFSFMDGRDDF